MSMMSIKTTYDTRIPDTQDKTGTIKHALAQTHKHSLEQLEWLVTHIQKEWDAISEHASTNARLTKCEKLFHATAKNLSPKYPEYDKLYGYTPSYIRRSLFRKAIGHVASYHANHNNWVKNGKQGDEPRLGKCRASLCFFKDQSSKWETELEEREREIRSQVKARRSQEKAKAEASGKKNHKHEKSEDVEVLELLALEREKLSHEHGNVIEIKLYDGKCWGWYQVRLKKSDVDYINKYCSHALRDCPTLKKRGKTNGHLASHSHSTSS